jgi:hypothetical protein
MEEPPIMNTTTNATADDTNATIAEEEGGRGEQTTPTISAPMLE